MIDLGFTNVSGAVVGSVYTIDWHNVRREPTLKQQGQNISDSLAIYNESACGFKVLMTQTSRTFTLPAGGWAPNLPLSVPGGVDLSLTLTVEYILPSPAVSQVHADYYGPGEFSTNASIALGNSPVNGSVSGVVATSVVNTGNTSGTVIVNGSSSPGTGSILENNDGSRTVRLLDNGISAIYESLVNGTNLTSPVVAYGSPTNLQATTYNGQGNFANIAFQTLGNINGIATNGSFFAAVISSLRQHVAVNTATTIITISAPITGTYRVNGMVDKGNATASAITFNVSWTAPITGVQTRNFSCDNAGAYLNLRGTTTVGSTVLPCFPIVFDATVSTTISVSFTDPTGTANDNVTAILECFV